jgi:hypothetical protein
MNKGDLKTAALILAIYVIPTIALVGFGLVLFVIAALEGVNC